MEFAAIISSGDPLWTNLAVCRTMNNFISLLKARRNTMSNCQLISRWLETQPDTGWGGERTRGRRRGARGLPLAQAAPNQPTLALLPGHAAEPPLPAG